MRTKSLFQFSPFFEKRKHLRGEYDTLLHSFYSERLRLKFPTSYVLQSSYYRLAREMTSRNLAWEFSVGIWVVLKSRVISYWEEISRNINFKCLLNFSVHEIYRLENTTTPKKQTNKVYVQRPIKWLLFLLESVKCNSWTAITKTKV